MKRMSFGSTPADEGILEAKMESITRFGSREVMEAIDEATKKTLASMYLEAFRFDIDICPDEGWLRVKIKIRPTTVEKATTVVQSRPARG